MRKFALALTIVLSIGGWLLLRSSETKRTEATTQAFSKRESKTPNEGASILSVFNRAPASVPSQSGLSPAKAADKNRSIPLPNIEANEARYEAYRALASKKTRDWVNKYSSKKLEQKVGAYTLTHLDHLSAIPKSRFKGKALEEHYAYAIVPGRKLGEVQVYLDQSQDRIVLLSGRASVKPGPEKLVLPAGAKVIFTAEGTGIVHVQFKPGTDPVLQLSELQSKNKNIKWANLEVIDRMERVQ